MKIVIELNRDDLIAAIKAGEPVTIETAPAKAAKAGRPKKVKEAEVKAPEADDDEEDDEDEEEVLTTKIAANKAEIKAIKAKGKKAPVKEDDDEDEDEDEDDEAEEETEEEADDDDEEPYVVGADLAKLKKALNAHKAANGGKAKKTLDILRKFAPGGSEKVKSDVLPKLLKALKV